MRGRRVGYVSLLPFHRAGHAPTGALRLEHGLAIERRETGNAFSANSA